MSDGPSRFRTGGVSGPATPIDRLRAVLDDAISLQEQALLLAAPAMDEGDDDTVLEILGVVREHQDPHRVYLIHRLIAQFALAGPERTGAVEGTSWARFYDLVPDMLMPLLREQPSEPELLNLLGVAYYELGETPTARRLFEAIKTLDPEHLQARRNLRACKERTKRPGISPVAAHSMPRAAALQTEVKRLTERAVRLPDVRISLCMIVKDEEEMLPACLAAAAPWVDEMIVVDTGSTDDTRRIAEEAGATVIDFPWTGSFAEARNRSLEDATGDWVLYLDADEHMVENDGKWLREYAQRPWLEGVYLVETHFTGEFEMGAQTTHTPMRLFRRHPWSAWKGKIHEQVMHNMPSFVRERFANSPVRVNHYGYLKEVIADRDKRHRNLELLIGDEDDGTAFTQFNIGSEYAGAGRWDQALPYFERAYEIAQTDSAWQTQQFAPMMVGRLITSRRMTGSHAGALELIETALGWWPEFTDLVFERAVLHHERHEYSQAREQAERCLQMGDAPARFVAAQGKGTFQARLVLATLAKERGDLAEARHHLETALVEAPHFLPTVLDLAEILLREQSPDEVAAYFVERLGAAEEGPSASLLLATAFYEAGFLEHAERYYQRVLSAQPHHSAALIGLAEIRLSQNRAQDAIELAATVGDADPLAIRAARTRFLAGVLVNDPLELEGPLRSITGTAELPLGERTFYAAWHAKITGGHAILPPDEDAATHVLANLEALAKLEAPDEFEQLCGLLGQALPDPRTRHHMLGGLYLRRRFADMAAQEYMQCYQEFGPDAQTLTGLGKAATMKELWEDAEVFLEESLKLDPSQGEASRLLQLIKDRQLA